MASSERSLGEVIGAIACFLCILLLVSIAIGSGSATMAMPPIGFHGMSSSSSSLSSSSSSSRYRPNAKMSLDPLNTIKRRVPNGADPIHNRREGKSGRPLGRA